MKELIIRLPGEPMPKQSDRTRIVWPRDAYNLTFDEIKKKVFISHYQSTKIKSYQEEIRYRAKSQFREAGFRDPHEGPILITNLVFAFKPITSLKAHEQKAIGMGELIPKHTKPDVDNLRKPLFDAMEGLVYKNDSQIVGVMGQAIKVYWKKPGTFIKMLLFDDRDEYRKYVIRELEIAV